MSLFNTLFCNTPISHYHIPDQSIKPSLWIYRNPSPYWICFCLLIKILPNQLIDDTKFVCFPLSIPPAIPLACPFQNIYELLRIIIYISRPCKIILLPYIMKQWKRDIICCGGSTIQICINPWKFTRINFHIYGNKCISLSHEYTYCLLIGTPTFKSPYSIPLLLSSLYTPISCMI